MKIYPVFWPCFSPPLICKRLKALSSLDWIKDRPIWLLVKVKSPPIEGCLCLCGINELWWDPMVVGSSTHSFLWEPYFIEIPTYKPRMTMTWTNDFDKVHEGYLPSLLCLSYIDVKNTSNPPLFVNFRWIICGWMTRDWAAHASFFQNTQMESSSWGETRLPLLQKPLSFQIFLQSPLLWEA